jgi:hypothetical protein
MLILDLLPDTLAVCRLAADRKVPDWAWQGGFASVTRTDDELSIVCASDAVPDGVAHTPGWRAFKVRGPLDFGLVGILAGLSGVLAEAEVSIFALSTHDTDYILVRAHQLDQAVAALEGAGYRVEEGVRRNS